MNPSGPTRVDVLIVGAGPSGAYLGHLLARRGIEVGIIERDEMPRDKVCGGGLSRKAIELLDLDVEPLVHRWIHGAHLSYRGGGRFLKHTGQPIGCTVLRREFDAFLLGAAAAAGARVWTGTPMRDARQDADGVEVTVDGGPTLRCRLLIGADGVASTVRGRFFGPRLVRYVPALEALVAPPPQAPVECEEHALFDFGALPHGYGWVFPKRDHWNVGVYSPYGGAQLRRHLGAFLEQLGVTAAPSQVKFLGFPIPLRNARRRFQTERVWLLGDAAGLAEGVFGEGIYFALKSAALAAQAIEEGGLAPANNLYTARLEHTLLPELRAARWLGRALYAAPGYAFSHLVSHARINELFAGTISGAVGYRECLWRTLVAAPHWLLRARGAAASPALDR